MLALMIICSIVTWLLYFIVDQDNLDVRGACLGVVVGTICLSIALAIVIPPGGEHTA